MVDLVQDFTSFWEQSQAEVIAWRRHLHEHPELSFQEVNTSNYVYHLLCSLPELEVSRPTATSVMARLIGAQKGSTLAIRADMDALPIQEDTSLPFASKNPGVMHACGHDMHTAILLGVVKYLVTKKEDIRGEIRFIFQHAEEYIGGAKEMVAAGALDGVDKIIGLHVAAMYPVGLLGVREGVNTAASDSFDLTIHGKGGHGSAPQTSVDSIAIAAQVVTNLQHIVSRDVDPMDSVVISVTKFQSGTAYNVIPEQAKLAGTIRTFNPTLRDQVPSLMERIAKGIVEAHGAAYDFTYHKGYDPVVNDPLITRQVRTALVEHFGEKAVQTPPPQMGSEDFSGYLTKVPGFFLWVGAGGQYPHHHPRFEVDEKAIFIGIKAFIVMTQALLP